MFSSIYLYILYDVLIEKNSHYYLIFKVKMKYLKHDFSIRASMRIFFLSLILDLIFVFLNRHMLIIFLSNHLQGLIALRKIHVFTIFTKVHTNLTRIKESLNSWIMTYSIYIWFRDRMQIVYCNQWKSHDNMCIVFIYKATRNKFGAYRF